jgi:DNA gyrase subunit B
MPKKKVDKKPVKKTTKSGAKKAPQKKSNKPKAGEYKAAQITVLEGLDPVRKRPGMYIGSTGAQGLHHMLWEVVDNGIDEAMAGYANLVVVTLLPDGLVEVYDNGRGIPVDIHKTAKVSALEVVMTKLHAGGKFGQGGYKVSGGLHGVGVSVVNALSTYMKAEVYRDGKVYEQEYAQGKPKRKVRSTGKTRLHGTKISFIADGDIFDTLEFDWTTILTHFRQQAYLTKGIKIKIFDERHRGKKKSYEFYFEGGIKSYVTHLNHNNQTKHDNVFYVEKSIIPTKNGNGNGNGDGEEEVKEFQASDQPVNVEIAFQYVDEYNESVYAFANNIFNPEGGMHMVGFRTALTRILNNYARNKGILKEKDENLSGEDVREGMTSVISVKVTDPQFEGQTKAKLGNPEVRAAVDSVFSEALLIYLEENPRDAEAIIGKCLLSAQARRAAKTAREAIIRKGALEGMTLPGKLSDCSSRDAEVSELFIVEGDSAGGCFSGDTKVALADGRNISFRQLVKEDKKGKKNYCYTVDKDENITIALIKYPRITKKEANVIKVILDNDEEIICTPDHKFRLVDGSYVEAKDLKNNLSLAPLYRKKSKIEKRITIKGYEMIYNFVNNKWIFTHMLADQYNLRKSVYSEENGSHKHHIDFNKLNNNPENIIRMTPEGHLRYHVEWADKTLRTPEVLEKLRKIRKTPEYRAKIRKTMLSMRDELSARAKEQWKDEKYKKYMGKKYMEFYNSNEEYREKVLNRLNKSQKRYWSSKENRVKQSENTKKYYEEHPEQKKLLAKISDKQWKDQDLLKWRAEETKKQWTDEFRSKRKKAYDKTYYSNTISSMKRVLEKTGSIDSYDIERTKKRNTNLLRMQTFMDRFFNSDYNRMKEAVECFNHKIKRIEKVSDKIDVYDIEVEDTHNFALSSGVFVHNSSKQGRDRETQAILPLRGKILNVERARLDKMLTNNEIKSLVIALGTNIGEQFEIEKLRYNKIVIMTDADVDGSHIRTLLLTLFFRYFPELVRNGHIYIAHPPLFKLQKGKEAKYVYSEEEKDKVLERMTGIKKSKKTVEEAEVDGVETDTGGVDKTGVGEKVAGVSIQRYKGLGEMNPDQLWETTMDPVSRLMSQVNIEQAEKADEVFEMLMGADVLPRKRFIQTHAKDVKNLDV